MALMKGLTYLTLIIHMQFNDSAIFLAKHFQIFVFVVVEHTKQKKKEERYKR